MIDPVKHRRTLLLGLGSAACLLAGACGGDPAADPTIGVPVALESSAPRLVVEDEDLRLVWIDGDAGAPVALRTAVFGGGGWSEPLTVVEGSGLAATWADGPVWLTPSNGGPPTIAWHATRPGAGLPEVRIAAVLDGVAAPGQRLHDDRAPAERGFVSLLDEGDGVGVVWLDGPPAAGRPAATRLMYRRLVGGELSPARVLDDDVCSCCATAAVVTSAGRTIVAYRDHAADEIRDVTVVVRDAGEWSAPRRIDTSGWRIAGCPVNGPALAASGSRVALAWFTAADGAPRVLAALSDDGGASFAEARRIDDGDPLGRVDVAMAADGTPVVVWLESAGADAEVRLRALRTAEDDESRAIVRTTAGRESGFPRVAIMDGRAVLAWTETVPRSRVRLATSPI